MNLYLNEKKTREKGIDDTNLYLKLSNLYKKTFEEYLSSIIDFKKYDDILKNSDLEFIIPEIENPTLNALSEYLGLSYIYNVNNYFIEKLSVSDLEILKSGSNLTDLVKRTYKEVIKYCDDESYVGYDPFNEIVFARNDAVVFKIYYKIVDSNNDIDVFLAKDKKIKEVLNYVITSIKNDVESKFDINCDILTEMCI